MRIVAIDGSTIAGGSVARAVETAARAAERAGAIVIRVRLYDAFRETCLDCGRCRKGGTCPLPEPLAPLFDLVESADGLIVGDPPSRGFVAEDMRGLLDRLVRRFSKTPRRITTRNCGRCAVVVAQAGVALPDPLGRIFEQASPVRRRLASRGVETVGCLLVSSAWSDPQHRDNANGRASVLGKRLVRAIA